MNMIQRKLALGSLMAASLFTLQVQAQEIKLGFVNTERIFREATTAKQAQAKLEQEFSRREKEIVENGNSLKLASERFER
jgi:outer membrane protein